MKINKNSIYGSFASEMAFTEEDINNMKNTTNPFLDQQINYFNQRHKDDVVDAIYYGIVNKL